MDNFKYILASATLLLTACDGAGFGAEPSPAQQASLLRNPDFEAPELAPWFPVAHADATAYVVELDRDIHYRGEQSLRIDATGREPWGGIRQDVTDPSFAAGGSWKLSLWLRGRGTSAPAQAFVLFQGGHGAPPPEQALEYFGSDYDWQRVEWQFDIPEGTNTVRLGIMHYGLGTIWIDDVALKPAKK